MVEDPVITFRIPPGLKREIEEEIQASERNNNLSEFIKDAIKFYLRDLQDRRQWKHTTTHEIDLDDKDAE